MCGQFGHPVDQTVRLFSFSLSFGVMYIDETSKNRQTSKLIDFRLDGAAAGQKGKINEKGETTRRTQRTLTLKIAQSAL